MLVCGFMLVACLGMVGSRGRSRAKETICLFNLSRWGSVWSDFVNDNDGMLWDGGGGWSEVVMPYVHNEKLFLCPEATQSINDGAWIPFVASTYASRVPLSYGINQWAQTEPHAGGTVEQWLWKSPFIAKASQVPFILDIAWYGRALPHH